MTIQTFQLSASHARLIDVDLHPCSPNYGTAPITVHGPSSGKGAAMIGFHRLSTDARCRLSILLDMYPPANMGLKVIYGWGGPEVSIAGKSLDYQLEVVERCAFFCSQAVEGMLRAHSAAALIAEHCEPDIDSRVSIPPLDETPLWLELTASFHHLVSRRLVIDTLQAIFRVYKVFATFDADLACLLANNSNSQTENIPAYYESVRAHPISLEESVEKADGLLREARRCMAMKEKRQAGVRLAQAALRLCPYWPLPWFCAPFEARVNGVAKILMEACFGMSEVMAEMCRYDESIRMLDHMKSMPWIANAEMARLYRCQARIVSLHRDRYNQMMTVGGKPRMAMQSKEARLSWGRFAHQYEILPPNDFVRENPRDGQPLQIVQAYKDLKRDLANGQDDLEWPIGLSDVERDRLDAWKARIRNGVQEFEKEMRW